MGEEVRGRTERIRGRVNSTEHIVWGKSIFNLKKKEHRSCVVFCTLCGNFYRLRANTATWTGRDPGSLKI